MWSILYYLYQSSCNIQDPLRFNMSHRPIPDGLPIYNPNETLAQAICCDKRYQGFAETRWTFNHTDVRLFDYLSETQDNYFYDSNCGLPLFVVPRGRTLDDFKQETLEHGWPSFHDEEIIEDHVQNVSGTSHVVSRCGTHLGDNLPEKGHNRYCLDLVCISGSPKYFQNLINYHPIQM
jgi:peptide methionine sulfoxide reductase MsrB